MRCGCTPPWNYLDICYWVLITTVCKCHFDKGPSKRLQHPFDFVEWQCWKRLPFSFDIVETCWKDVESMLKEFKSLQTLLQHLSTFLLFSGMFGMLKRSWSHLPRSFNIVEQAHVQLRTRNRGHHGCKDGSKARQYCVWLIVRAYLSFEEITLFPPRTCFRVIPCSLKLSIRWKSAWIIRIISWVIFRCVFDPQFLDDVVKYPLLSRLVIHRLVFPPPSFFILIIPNFESYKNC